MLFVKVDCLLYFYGNTPTMRYIWIAFLLIITACGKDSIIIDGNTPPPDSTIETAIVDNYINKLYISMLGREPSNSEFSNAKNILSEAVSIESREQLIDIVHNNEEYYDNLFDIYRSDYLNGGDTVELREQYIEVYADLIEYETNPIILEVYQLQYQNLLELYNLGEDLKNGSINTVEAHKRCVNNLVYDDINMGTENYVVSMFQNFLHRYPTLAELKNASIMVDGEQANCFGVNGDSKSNFNDIFFNHYGYFEGVVIDTYSKLLFREPSSAEASFHAIEFMSDLNFKELQKSLLASNEFLGIE